MEAKRIKRERKDMQIRQARRERLEEKARIEIGRKVDDVLGDDGNGELRTLIPVCVCALICRRSRER